jgi:hypothetical protein
MMTQLLQVILLASTQAERWAAARHPLTISSATEGWLTGFAMAALIISLILVFYLSARHRRSMDEFSHKIAGLSAHIDELQHKIAELSQQTPAEVPEQIPSEESEKFVAVQKS